MVIQPHSSDIHTLNLLFGVLGTIFLIYSLLVSTYHRISSDCSNHCNSFFFFIVNCSLPGDFGFDPLGLGMPFVFYHLNYKGLFHYSF